MDRRIKYTKKIIKDTFLELLEVKEINKITISEVCEIADINRATFYRYYLDLYDLLDKIEEEFINELKNTIDDKDYSIFSFSEELLNIFLQNKKILKVIFKSQNNIYFLTPFLEVAYEKCKIRWQNDIPNIQEKNIEYAATFIFNGALGIINFWVQNDFDLPTSDISKIIENLSYNGISKFIYNKKYRENN